MRYSHILIASAAVAAALASPASAHRQWLLPSTTTLAGTSEYVTVDAAVSNDLFYPDHFPMSPEQVTVWAPDGSEGKIENPATGRYRATFDVKIDKPGTWKIGTQRSAIMGSFKVNGEDWRLGGRGRPMGAGGPGAGGPGAGGPGGAPGAGGPGGPGGAPVRSVATVADIPANATDVKLTESISGNYIYVTADAPTKTVFTPTGKGLEIDPITHPDELVSNEEGQFRFLIDGKPAAGVKVTVVPGSKKYREAEQAQELTTGADGVLHVKWPVAGMYWINASASDNKPSEKRATERRMSYTATVEVVAP
ncbi:DUF4198 domain-containing protein [Novosphingobium aerophilum]|uniref:DUF4198 domain-containing protein n=1 Tax=Novosphingobium aerophilum TaxID=2839843 RepID=UPI003FCFDC8A